MCARAIWSSRATTTASTKIFRISSEKSDAEGGSMTKARKLRELLARREFFIAPGAYDAMMARLVEQAGFPAVKLLGNATTASLLGLPDLGFLSLMEVVNHARNVA